MLNGPQRLKHRHWEDWWGWETGLTGLHTHFFDLLALEQEHAMLTWYSDKLDWLTQSGLLRRR